MALTPNPLDALKKLLGTSPDLDADNPEGLVQGRLGQEHQAEEDLRSYENAQSNPGISFSGATPSTFGNLAKHLSASPNFGDAAQARVQGIQHANDAALQAGFTGDRDIAGPASGGGNPLGHDLYANVGDRSGLSPAAMAGRSASAMESAKVNAPVLAAGVKAQGDFAQEQEKGRQQRQSGQAEFERTANFLRGGSGATQGAPGANPAASGSQPPPTAPGAPQGAPGAPSAPSQSQSWMQYLSGTGDRPQNDLMSALHAAAERAKYGYMSTPLASMIQNESFGNLEQLQAQFPGVRGFSYLLPKLKEHQANFGKGETPDASYNRLNELINIMGQVESEMGDPATHATMGDHGQLKITATPAAIQRALAAVKDTKGRFSAAMQQMKQQYPGLASPISTPPNGRFERVQD